MKHRIGATLTDILFWRGLFFTAVLGLPLSTGLFDHSLQLLVLRLVQALLWSILAVEGLDEVEITVSARLRQLVIDAGDGSLELLLLTKIILHVLLVLRLRQFFVVDTVILLASSTAATAET